MKGTEKMEDNNNNIKGWTPSSYKRYYGATIEKIENGDMSFGACISYDKHFGEFYLYINLIKWTISIGRLIKWGLAEEE